MEKAPTNTERHKYIPTSLQNIYAMHEKIQVKAERTPSTNGKPDARRHMNETKIYRVYGNIFDSIYIQVSQLLRFYVG